MEELYPEIPMELDITDRQRNAIENMDLNNRRHVIQALMKQQGLLDTEQPLNNDVLSQAKDYLNPYTAIENTPATDDTAQDEKRRQAEADSVRKAYHHDEDAEDIPDTNDLTEKNEATNNKDTVSDYQLGTLSSKYESLKNPAAIGHDNGGGYSYGTFQIETKHGTMKDYLNYLAKNEKYQNFAQELQKSGGYNGALNKTDEFVNMWEELATNKDFIQSQYQFIFDMKFKPLLRGIAKIDGFDIEKRHPIIKDVLFSMAVQHGQNGALKIIQNALGNNAKNLDDETLINKLYDERSDVDKYLSMLPIAERRKIKQNRYSHELKDALKALKK